jgi:hypothetical protein
LVGILLTLTLQRLGLVGEEVDVADEETNINILFDMALERIAFLPFGYLVDKFRWDVYSGVTSKEDMNCHWWKLRNEIQVLIQNPNLDLTPCPPGPGAPQPAQPGPLRPRREVPRGGGRGLRALLHRLHLRVPVLP